MLKHIGQNSTFIVFGSLSCTVSFIISLQLEFRVGYNHYTDYRKNSCFNGIIL